MPFCHGLALAITVLGRSARDGVGVVLAWCWRGVSVGLGVGVELGLGVGMELGQSGATLGA